MYPLCDPHPSKKNPDIVAPASLKPSPPHPPQLSLPSAGITGILSLYSLCSVFFPSFFSSLFHFPKHHGQLYINSSAFIINCCWCRNVNCFPIWRPNLLFSREMSRQQQNRTLKIHFPAALLVRSQRLIRAALSSRQGRSGGCSSPQLPPCSPNILVTLPACSLYNLTLAGKRKEANGKGGERRDEKMQCCRAYELRLERS